MKTILTFVSALMLALTLVAVATATPPKTQTFDKRFSCVGKLSAATLNQQFAATGWSAPVSFKSEEHHVYAPDAFSTCKFGNPGGGGGSVTVYYGPDAAKTWHRAKTTSSVTAGQACKNIAAKGEPAPTDPRSCTAVPVSGFGEQAFENVSCLVVLRGDVYVQFCSGGKLLDDGEYMGGNLVVPPASIIETCMTQILSRLPKHS